MEDTEFQKLMRISSCHIYSSPDNSAMGRRISAARALLSFTRSRASARSSPTNNNNNNNSTVLTDCIGTISIYYID